MHHFRRIVENPTQSMPAKIAHYAIAMPLRMFLDRMTDITQMIAGVDLANLLIEEPDLEEIFMHYYQKEDQP